MDEVENWTAVTKQLLDRRQASEGASLADGCASVDSIVNSGLTSGQAGPCKLRGSNSSLLLIGCAA